MTDTRGILFVGSLGMPDAETALRTVAEAIGDRAKRYPDGEPGKRAGWIRCQIDVFEANADMELVHRVNVQAGGERFDRPYFRPMDGVDPAAIDFGSLGYVEEAVKSYAIFKGMKSDGTIGAGTRFQVCLPTPAAVIFGFIDPEMQAAVEPAYERAMVAEVAKIVAAIPAEELAIQWDIASEVIAADGGPQIYYDDTFDGTVARVSRLCEGIPENVELGIHLCYGDPGHKHVVEPPDLANSVRYANALSKAISRRLDWMHMPVPRDRDDDAYYAPLGDLDMAPDTELYLGLVHHTGGFETTRRRMQAANKFVTEYGVATECGLGRREPDTLSELFAIHREASDA